MTETRGGPLSGLKIVEMAGIGPAPFAGMMLADMGADVLRIDRREAANLGIDRPDRFNFTARGKRSVAVDLKRPDGIGCVLDLVGRADALIEGFRPGVMERLGLGPEPCLSRNPRLVFGRLTGWGQDGPLAQAAGHDLNFISLSGVLDAIGRAGQPPTPPLNLVGDFGGGGMLLAFGVVCAILKARETGLGQVVDAAAADGAALLSAPVMGLRGAGLWEGGRGENILDGGAPHYDVYRCADGLYVSVAPIEGKFRAILLRLIGLSEADFPDVADRANWPAARRLLETRFLERTRDEWCALLEGTDACFAPVLTFDEAPSHPHNTARGTYVSVDGAVQPAPAPRFGRTPAPVPGPAEPPGGSGGQALRSWGFSDARCTELERDGVIGRAP
jgi:alpha-methylacyl-CoA racemase